MIFKTVNSSYEGILHFFPVLQSNGRVYVPHLFLNSQNWKPLNNHKIKHFITTQSYSIILNYHVSSILTISYPNFITMLINRHYKTMFHHILPYRLTYNNNCTNDKVIN